MDKRWDKNHAFCRKYSLTTNEILYVGGAFGAHVLRSDPELVRLKLPRFFCQKRPTSNVRRSTFYLQKQQKKVWIQEASAKLVTVS